MQQTQLIAVTRADGSLSIMHFVLRDGVDATPDNVAAELGRAGMADARSWRLISPEDLPTSREHRASWRDTGTEIEVAP